MSEEGRVARLCYTARLHKEEATLPTSCLDGAEVQP